MVITTSKIEPLPSWSSQRTLATFHNGDFAQPVAGVGRTIQKSKDDLDRYREVIEDTSPEVIVETGTRWGGSALWFYREFGLPVITVDIEPHMTPAMVPIHGPDFRSVVGSSVDPAIVSKVIELVDGRRTMVTLDSDHHAPHVVQEIQLYSNIVSRGCFMVVEDACFDMWTGEDARRGAARIPEVGGPLVAINTSGLPVDPRFRRDLEIEGWSDISHSPCGWWERL